MILNELHIEQFGSLKKTTLGPLSRRITVFRGPNGCGKTTAVEFLRSMVFGMNRTASSFSRAKETEGGTLSFVEQIRGTAGFAGTVNQSDRRLRLSRTRHQGATETHMLLNQASGLTEQLALTPLLPAWVTADVYNEIFTVGYEEAARFDLLTRLCLETTLLSSADDPEILQAENALSQTLRERDGSGVTDGIASRLAAVRGERAELLAQLEKLRRPEADLPERIHRVAQEIEEIVAELSRYDQRLAEMDLEIEQLELQLAELRRRNSLPSAATGIEARIRAI
ncbi:MAG: AAA family ATPase, partial [Planctomycetaceae bacterium]|nr:AAA family ATPase [Planctomycetaceae bacterium]